MHFPSPTLSLYPPLSLPLCLCLFLSLPPPLSLLFSGGNKQKWVPLNIEPSRPSSRGFYRHRGESRDHWHAYSGGAGGGSGKRGEKDFNDRDRRDRGGGGRFDRGRDRDKPHRPLRFDRDHAYKSRDHRGGGGNEHYLEDGEGVYHNGRSGNWTGGAGPGGSSKCL